MSEATYQFEIEDDNVGKRLDHFLTEAISGVSRSALRRWIDNGHVLLNGAPPKAGQALRLGDQIEVDEPAPAPVELIPEDIPLEIHYEDDYLLVVDKPAGLVVHPGAGNPTGTLANALVHHFQQISRNQTLRPGIVHRLDKGTSGLLVVAKSDPIHEALADQFKARTVEKEYLALVFGKVKAESGRIDLPLGRHPHDRVKFSTQSRKTRSALTTFRVEERFRQFTSLRLELHTGRTHQIRVHCAAVGHPVVGDELYGGNRWKSLVNRQLRSAVRKMDRLFLHATVLAFTHPKTNERVRFESSLPTELAGLLERLK